MADYDRRLADLERGLRAIPSRFAGGGAVPPALLIVGWGNTIKTAGAVLYKGLKYPSADVLEVPDAAPALITTTCPEGISPAYLVTTAGAVLVWIGTRLKPGTAAAVTDMAGSFYRDTPVLCIQQVSMPITGSSPTAYASVYLPHRL